MPFILLAMRIFVGAVFVYSGWSKLISPIENFMAVIEGYQFIKQPYISTVAFVLPWLELIFGTFLSLGFLTRVSSTVLSIFLAVFITLLLRSLMLHLPVAECGCFGSGIILTPWQALFLDSGILVVSLILVRQRPRWLSLDRILNR
ncbi:MAG: hypothetical protein A3C35_04165 [Omnitrophica bacterium RIFCSPHIGHO2_02_FULL_46_11]|nr:MAG: hypothetical protein A3C35_04165 [Omnitrophica bacterium RIFCSPHIGHO2_02_FULL_46_11]